TIKCSRRTARSPIESISGFLRCPQRSSQVIRWIPLKIVNSAAFARFAAHDCGALGSQMPNATTVSAPAELERKMDDAIARYPGEHRRSAAMPLLHLWQEHFGFVSDEATVWIAEKLGLQPIHILELVTFYPMFRRQPAGKTHIRVCR